MPRTIRSHRPGRTRKTLATLAVIGVAGAVAGVGTFSAFSSTTTNPANSFASGTVVLTDNDADTAMYQLTNQKPGVTTERCIAVTYTGSLDADVRLYSPSTIGALGPYVDLTITRGTQTSPTFPSCAGFTPAATDPTLFSGTLAGFTGAHSSYENGLATFPAEATKWTSAEGTVSYRFSVAVQDDNAAQGLTTDSHDFSWQARSQ